MTTATAALCIEGVRRLLPTVRSNCCGAAWVERDVLRHIIDFVVDDEVAVGSRVVVCNFSTRERSRGLGWSVRARL